MDPSSSDRRRAARGAARRSRLTGRIGPVLVVAAAAACLGVLLLQPRAGAQPQAPNPNDFTPEEVAAGRVLFLAHCASCHGVDGGGTANGPSIIEAGAAAANFQLRTGRMPLAVSTELPVRHPPAFPPEQIRQLTAFVASLDQGPPIPTLLPGNLSNGQQLYSINCAQCHGASGAGGALGYGDNVPSLHHASQLDVAEAVRTGPGPMPVFGPQSLSEQQVSDIATYVEYLHHPDDPGGLGLGHLGPIPEGFVAWMVGMGLLLLVARLIGTRA